MTKKIIPIIFILWIQNAFSDLAFDTCMDIVVSNLLNQQYAKAYERVENVLESDPDNIDALFMRLNAIQIEIMDYESYVLDGEKFVRTLDSTLTFFEKFIHPADVDDQVKYLFYTGTIYGMRSLILAKLGEWIPAVKNARTSVKLIKEARDLDTTLYEAFYGIGLYDYYVGVNLKWIPFMKGRARKGIRKIKKVVHSTSPLSYMARNSLSWIYIEKEEYSKADALVSPVLAKYPDNTIYLRIRARLALLLDNHEDAIIHGRRLIQLSYARNPVNWSDLVDAYQIIVASLDAMGKHEECLRIINEALDLKVPVSAKKIEYVQKHLNFITIKKKEIEKKL